VDEENTDCANNRLSRQNFVIEIKEIS
jgi:hypothetical protein